LRCSDREHDAAGCARSAAAHHAFDETFYVLEGELTFKLGDELSLARAGEVAFARAGTPHTFTNRSEAPARFLIVCTPAGFEREFARRAAALAGIEPPSWAVQPIPEVTVIGPPISDDDIRRPRARHDESTRAQRRAEMTFGASANRGVAPRMGRRDAGVMAFLLAHPPTSGSNTRRHIWTRPRPRRIKRSMVKTVATEVTTLGSPINPGVDPAMAHIASLADAERVMQIRCMVVDGGGSR
jgi:uncharacterized RmlC-like cupin family protein